MPRTQITGEQVLDGDIQRVDMDIITPGQAMIRKVIAGAGMVILNSTGVDEGTGDVTLGAVVNPTISSSVQALSTKGVPGGGFLMLSHSGVIPYSKVPLVVFSPIILDSISISVGSPDLTRSFNINLYSDPDTVPLFDQTLLVLPAGQTITEVSNSNIPIAPGKYGIALERVGSLGSSTFKDVVVNAIIRTN